MKQIQPLKLEDLTVEQKLGLMFLGRSPINEESLEFMLELVRNHALGGIHISTKHSRPDYVLDIKRVREIIAQIKEAADYPIFICEDMEYGYPHGEIPLPAPLAVSSTGKKEYAYEFGRLTAMQARKDGYNMVFGPLLDVNRNPESCYLGGRTFGGTREMVADFGSEAVRGYQESGLLVTGKHYPGFGKSPYDSHIDMVVLDSTKEELIEEDIYPYLEAIKRADLSGIMVGHIKVPSIDKDYPATLSPKLVGLIRELGYQGIMMTDSLAMVGITNYFSTKDCYKLALKAGIDMVMGCYRTEIKTSYEWMLEAYKEGYVTDEQINEAVKRIIKTQERLLQAQMAAPVMELTEKDEQIAREMAKEAIAVRLEGVDTAALDVNKRHLFVIQTGNYYINPKTGQMCQEACHTKQCEEALRKRFKNSEFVTMSAYPCKPETENMLHRSTFHDSVVMVLYSYNISYTGSSDATGRMLAMMNGVRHKLSAVIHFGNPYAVRQYGSVPRVIFGYDEGYCYEYAAQVLAGEYVPTGKVPYENPMFEDKKGGNEE